MTNFFEGEEEQNPFPSERDIESLVRQASRLAINSGDPVIAKRYEHAFGDAGNTVMRTIDFWTASGRTAPITSSDRLSLFTDPTTLEFDTDYNIGSQSVRFVDAGDLPFDISPHQAMSVTTVALHEGVQGLTATESKFATDLPGMPANIIRLSMGTLNNTEPGEHPRFLDSDDVTIAIAPAQNGKAASINVRKFSSTSEPAEPGTPRRRLLDALTAHNYDDLATRHSELDDEQYVTYDFSRVADEAVTNFDGKWGLDTHVGRGTYLNRKLPATRIAKDGAAFLELIVGVAERAGKPFSHE